MTKSYVRTLIQYKEKNIFVPGLFYLVGFKQKGLNLQKISKQKTSYTLGKKLTLFFNGIIPFSSKPLEYISLFGLALILLVFAIVLWWIFERNLLINDLLSFYVLALMLFFPVLLLSV